MRLLVTTLALLILAAPMAQAQITGTATVQPAGPGPFDGYWCYTIDMDWSTPKSLSHLTIYVGLDNLECACDDGLFTFDSPAGTSTGVEDGVTCTLDYDGEYVCHGDPSLPSGMDDLAAVKWDPITEPCDAGKTGSGTFTFYSLLAPGPYTTHEDLLVIKNGQNASTGDVVGRLPQADCSVDAHTDSFGGVKNKFD